MTTTTRTTTKKLERLVRRLRREYSAAIRAEEAAPTEREAWRLAAKSDAALRALRAAEAGRPLAPKIVMNARAKARIALESLASIGRSIARALAREAALIKARAAAALARARRQAAKLARLAMRRVRRELARLVGLVTTNTQEDPMPTKKTTTATTPIAKRPLRAPVLPSSRIRQRSVGGLRVVVVDGELLERRIGDATVRCTIVGDRYELAGGRYGVHSLAIDGAITPPERLLAHWRGYVDATVARTACPVCGDGACETKSTACGR